MESEKKFGLVETLRTVICALHLTITFLVLSVKKRSPWQAILLLASTGATMTALLLPEEKIKRAVERTTKKQVTSADEESEILLSDEEVIEEEIFTAEESARAEAEMRETLCGNNDEESVSPSAKREIPRDEEASEEDFH